MRHFEYEIIKSARPETRPEIPKKLYWKAKFFGKQKILEFIWNYYERESEKRIPFYLPYIYLKECFDYLRRYAGIPKKQINMILIDDDDARTDYFLTNFLEDLNYLTIVTDRMKYFESLQERAFQELGLLIDLVHSWEEKNLQGNLVWDFSEKLQKEDCYPKGSVCFLPHKKAWKIEEVRKSCREIDIITLEGVEMMQKVILPSLAECFLVPADFPFRETRCEDLRVWCKRNRWSVKMNVQKPEKP